MKAYVYEEDYKMSSFYNIFLCIFQILYPQTFSTQAYKNFEPCVKHPLRLLRTEEVELNNYYIKPLKI